MLVTEPIKESRKNQRLSSILIAILVHALIIGGATLLVVLPNARKEPEIVAAVVAPPTQKDVQIEKKQIAKLAKEASSSSAASPIAKLIRASVTAAIAVPEVTKFSDGPLGLGEGDFGAGFGTSGSGGSGGKGQGSGSTLFGARTGDGLVGRLYDLKQTPNRQPTKADATNPKVYGKILQNMIRRDFSPSSVEDYFRASTELKFTYLAIPKVSAQSGPTAFQVQKEVKPAGWVVHYTGKVIPPEEGFWRFVGYFDDVVIVMINDRVVFDGSWFHFTESSASRKEFGGPSLISDNKAVAGRWFKASGPMEIDVIVGECPGGSLGGALMVEKRGANYEKRKDGTPILPIFATRNLDKTDVARLRSFHYKLAKETPVFQVILD